MGNGFESFPLYSSSGSSGSTEEAIVQSSRLLKLKDPLQNILEYAGPRSTAVLGRTNKDAHEVSQRAKPGVLAASLLQQASRGDVLKLEDLKQVQKLTPEDRERFNGSIRSSLNKKASTAEQGILILNKTYRRLYEGVKVSEEGIRASMPAANNPTEDAINQHMATQLYYTKDGTISAEQMAYLRSQYASIDDIRYDRTTIHHQYIAMTGAEAEANLPTLNTFFEAHPDKTLVLLKGGPDLNLRKEQIPVTLQKLAIVGNKVTVIGDNFLYNFRTLTTLDLSGLMNVTSIGHRFLFDCISLTTLDLSLLFHVTNIGNGFLHNCNRLTALDLSDLINLTSIGNFFIDHCNNLTTLNLSGLMNVTNIGNFFLCGCISLTTLDLSSLINLINIGNAFLTGCNRLTALDLSDLINLTSIGTGFLYQCFSLTILNLSGLMNVTNIGIGFLSDCNILTLIKVIGISDTLYYMILEKLDPSMQPLLTRS